MRRGFGSTDILLLPDAEVPGVESLRGRTEFLQLVGIARPEREALRAHSGRVEALTGRLRQAYPHLGTDVLHRESYL